MGDVFTKSPQRQFSSISSKFYARNLTVYFYNHIKVFFSPHFLNLQAIKTIGHHYDNKAFQLIKP